MLIFTRIYDYLLKKINLETFFPILIDQSNLLANRFLKSIYLKQIQLQLDYYLQNALKFNVSTN